MKKYKITLKNFMGDVFRENIVEAPNLCNATIDAAGIIATALDKEQQETIKDCEIKEINESL